MHRIIPIIATTLTLLSPLSREDASAEEVRFSPDGRYFVGWYDHDAGKPFGLIRPILLRSVSDPHDIFSLVSVPRHTLAAWNPGSSKCVIADAPDNGGPNTWLIHHKQGDEWGSMKLDPFQALSAEFYRTPNGATLFRPSILKISWPTETTVTFHAYCNLGTYLISIDTMDPNRKTTSVKLSDKMVEPDND